MAKEHAAFGTILAMGDGGEPETFTEIGSVKDIDGPSRTRDTIDVTNHQSPNMTKEFKASLSDSGTVTFTVGFDPADSTHDDLTGLESKLAETDPTNFKLIFPVAASVGFWGYAFSGLVTKITPKAPVSGELTADIEIKVSGQASLEDIDISGIC